MKKKTSPAHLGNLRSYCWLVKNPSSVFFCAKVIEFSSSNFQSSAVAHGTVKALDQSRTKAAGAECAAEAAVFKMDGRKDH